MARILWLIAVLLAPFHAARAEGDLDVLMARMREVRATTGSFTEQRHLALLSAPLRASGRLVYVAPDRLRKETLAPVPGLFDLDGDSLTVAGAGQPAQVLSLRRNPQIAALAEGIRATLAGDLATLQRHHTVTLAGGAAGWTLLLAPRDRQVREIISELHISGVGWRVESIETRAPGGDRTRMDITQDP